MSEYTPTTQEVMDAMENGWYIDSKRMRRWLFDIQEDAWEDGYQAGVHDGRYETVRETTNPFTDWTK